MFFQDNQTFGCPESLAMVVDQLSNQEVAWLLYSS